MDLRRIFDDNLESNFEFQGKPRDGKNIESEQSDDNKDVACWIFAYGSLCWNPGFLYKKCITGYIRGFVRRFWQGSVSHRGTPKRPGRVATLVAAKEGITWGCAYKVTGKTAFEYLNQRECTLGGYVTIDSKFFPRVATCDTEFCGEAFPVLIYIATNKNDLWLGDSSIENIAQEVCESQGMSGHNVEYVLRLAEFMREEIPDESDEHLFDLEYSILQMLARNNTSIYSLMGVPPERIRRDSHAGRQQKTTFEFTSRVPDKKLRCLNV